jgi:hypothetical protein
MQSIKEHEILEDLLESFLEKVKSSVSAVLITTSSRLLNYFNKFTAASRARIHSYITEKPSSTSMTEIFHGKDHPRPKIVTLQCIPRTEFRLARQLLGQDQLGLL